MKNNFKPNCDVLWPGSYPLTNAKSAIKLSLGFSNVIYHWPQLPKKSIKERMLEQTISAVESKNADFPRGYASGWAEIWKIFSKKRIHDGFFKSHITGPLTLFAKFGLDKNKKGKKRKKQSAELLMYAIDLWLRHAFWQIEFIKNKGFTPILVLDEPMFPNLIASTENPRHKKTLTLYKSIISRLQKKGALIGIHCCNRVSPELLIKTGVDLIHFDAIHFSSLLVPAKESIRNFLKDGGFIAWGIISTTEKIEANSIHKIQKYFMEYLEKLETKTLSLKKILSQSMVSPVCGTGFLRPDVSLEILETSAKISNLLKSNYGLLNK